MATHKTEALVIGAGPGGYVAAIRLGQLGVKTMIVEKEYFGGVCLNVGCIPSKALITAAKLAEQIRKADEIGISVGTVAVDYGKMQEWKSGITEKLTGGVRYLLKQNKVDILEGTARFKTPHLVEVDTGKGTDTVEAKHMIIATGSRSVEIPGFEFDSKHVLSSTDALALEEIPKKLVVIGGGYIGLELGMVYQKLGAKITVVELMDQLLPGTDLDLVKVVQKHLKADGADIHLKSKATKLDKSGGKGKVTIETDGEEQVVEAEKILVAVGFKPNSAGIGLEDAGAKLDDRGHIEVDEQMRTNVKTIFAIGDVAGEPMLAHKATREAKVAIETLAGEPAEFDNIAIPAVVFTDPELAWCGLTEAEAKEKEMRIFHGDRGYSFRTLFLPYLKGAKTIKIEDPYIRLPHQVTNFLRFCEVSVEAGTVESIQLTTAYDDEFKKQEVESSLLTIKDSLAEHGIELKFTFKPSFHDRRIQTAKG